MYRFPLRDFSNGFLYQVLVEYKSRCRENLTEAAFAEVEEAIRKASRTESRSAGSAEGRRKWEILYDEEHYKDCNCEKVSFLGVISDGERMLFFRTDGGISEACTCHVYNSLVMDEDAEECRYPWTAENDSILLGCLNGLEDPDEYCGDGSPVRTLEFKPAMVRVACPYCGTEETEYFGEDGPNEFHCPDPHCDRYFSREDIVREDLRHGIAHILIDTDEDDQLERRIRLPGSQWLPGVYVDKCYQIPGDGTIWFHIFAEEGHRLPVDEGGYVNFDDLPTESLRAILDALE